LGEWIGRRDFQEWQGALGNEMRLIKRKNTNVREKEEKII